MYRTLQMFKPLATKEWCDKNYKELVGIYQTQPKLRSKVIATLYVKLFGTILTVSRMYPTLEADRKEEISVVKLDFCCNHYKLTSKANFNTYFHGALWNHYANEIKKDKTPKHSPFCSALRTHDLVIARENRTKGVESGTYYVGPVADDKKIKLFELLNTIENSMLLDNTEKLVCASIVEKDCKNNKQISQCTGLTSLAISKVKKKIRDKVRKNQYTLV